VTQYIPKESTADTLKKLRSIISPGSTVLVTYVDQKCMGDITTLPRQYRWVRNLAAKAGEPWISGWSKEEFEKFIKECGYEVVSDTSQEDYNDTYLKGVGRQLDQDDLLSMERFVIAKKI
jgi:O-methyltransferase involved in polyketide biosynthesis